MSVNNINGNVTVAKDYLIKPKNNQPAQSSVSISHTYSEYSLSGSATVDSNGKVRVTTWIPNTFDSNVWYTLDKEGNATIQSCWTQPGEEKKYQDERLKDIYEQAYKKCCESRGGLNSEDSIALTKQIDEIVYEK